MDKKPDWERIFRERRGKIYWIDRGRLLHSFIATAQETTIVTRLALPKDYLLGDVIYEAKRRAFGFLIFSPEFAQNAIGAEFPSENAGEIKEIAVSIN